MDTLSLCFSSWFSLYFSLSSMFSHLKIIHLNLSHAVSLSISLSYSFSLFLPQSFSLYLSLLLFFSLSASISQSPFILDFDGRTAFDIAVEVDSDISVLSALLINSLPFDCETAEAISPSRHGFAWAKAVELDKYEPAVCDVLAKYPSFVQTLARSVDQVS